VRHSAAGNAIHAVLLRWLYASPATRGIGASRDSAA
jgi:hypothetical protein